MPDSFNITKQPEFDEIFMTYRAFLEPVEGSDISSHPRKKLYLKHIGESGISWCAVEPTGLVNVLIGRVGVLDEATLANAVEKLKEDNPVYGDKLVCGGGMYIIPVRYPLSKMVAPGYAAIGDAAFMTAPMIGSGMGNSIRAGKLLADAIINDKSVCLGTLWKYQVGYYKIIGKGDFNVDIIKRTLLKADNDDLKYIFECGLLTEKDLVRISLGKPPELTPKSIIDKARKGLKARRFIILFAKALVKGAKAESIAAKIPECYNEALIVAWQKELDSVFQSS